MTDKTKQVFQYIAENMAVKPPTHLKMSLELDTHLWVIQKSISKLKAMGMLNKDNLPPHTLKLNISQRTRDEWLKPIIIKGDK